MNKKKIIIWLMVVVLIVVGGFRIFKSKNNQIEYITEKVKQKDIKQIVAVTGEIVPIRKVDLAFEISGRVKNINVDIGDKVRQGDLLAELDSQSVLAIISQARTMLNIEDEKLKLMRRKWDDYKPEEKEAQKLAVKQKRQALWEASTQKNKTKLYAPISGIVTRKDIDLGETVAMNIPIISISSEEGFEIKAVVPESDIANIKIGQEADLEFDAISSEIKSKAKVTQIYPSATVIQDVIYYVVKLELITNLDFLREGMSVDANILTTEKRDVLAISSSAIKENNGQKYVEILSKDDEIKKIDVKTGLKDGEGNIEIISGLSVGDEVVTFTKDGK